MIPSPGLIAVLDRSPQCLKNKKASTFVEAFFRCPGLDSNQHILANAAT